MVTMPTVKEMIKTVSGASDTVIQNSRGCIICRNWKGEITDIIYDDDSRYAAKLYRMTQTC